MQIGLFSTTFLEEQSNDSVICHASLSSVTRFDLGHWLMFASQVALIESGDPKCIATVSLKIDHVLRYGD